MIGLSLAITASALAPRRALHLGGQPFPDPPQRVVARLGQQLAVGIPANGEPQEVHALVEVRDLGLVLVEDQTPGGQPFGKPRLDLLGLLTGVTQGEQIVGIADHRRAARHRLPGTRAGQVIPDSGSGLHAVQSNVQQQRADHPTLRSAGLCPVLVCSAW